MAGLVEHRLPVRKVGNSNPNRVKPMSFKIDSCRFRPWPSALIGEDKDWLAQDNVTEWDMGSHGAGSLVSQSINECALSQVSTNPDMTLDVAGLLNNKLTS